MVKNKQQRRNRYEELSQVDIQELMQKPLCHDLDENKRILQMLFEECSDIVFRDFTIEGTKTKATLIAVDGLVNTQLVDGHLLRSLLNGEGGESNLDLLQERTITATQMSSVENMGELVRQLLNGDTILLVDGNGKGLSVGLRGAEHRGVSEPETETVVRGPREGFTENIRTNTSMLRRKLKTPRLKMKAMVVGRETQTNLVISYLEGIVDPNLVQEVVKRIENIDIDGILESGYIEELIQDDTWSVFPQIMHTERPDTTAAVLLEGRVAVMVDGTPFVLIMPTTLWSMMQASEDYYERWQIGSLIRGLRIMLFLVGMLTPGLYIAIITFHQEMLPTSLLLSIAAARETIPFPAVVEALIMETAFEALREAGIRLPRTIGQAVSILGALVVGQAAVEAGIVSAPMVIVVSITGIASFTVPRFNLAISVRILRYPLMILAAVFGIFGIIIGTMLILGHLCKLRSFGLPYFSPVGPMRYADWNDTFVRMPLWSNEERPLQLNKENERRVGERTSQKIADKGGMKGEEK
ncbi:spore germination protein [Brevibacillus dissolubilis]|uniref:spore germination protein n=1 Tax=Brevibacillus dissolubilis TaxID=1844116 RepID=UPI0011169F1C